MPGTRYIGRANVRKRLEPLEGSPGHTSYAGGRAVLTLPDETLEVRPPFALAHEGEYDTIHAAPLLAALAEDHLVGALLVRLGGFAVGVFDGDVLVASKVGTRNVHGRHRAGGSSANRFRRRREKQARELVDAAAAEADRVLGPHAAALEALALGGDRFTAHEAFTAARTLARLEPRVLPRFFDVPDPRRSVLERLPYDLYAAEVVARQRR